MADAGLQISYVVFGLVEQLRAKGVFDSADLSAAANILEQWQSAQPDRPTEKAEALTAAIDTLRRMAG